MTQLSFFGLVYLMAAVALEHGVLPVLGDAAGLPSLGQTRLVALGVVLAAMVWGELEALPFALVGAVAASAAGAEGTLGITMLSFAGAAMLAGAAQRVFYPDRFSVRFFLILGLLLFESWAWSWMRAIGRSGAGVDIQWGAHIGTALFGAALHPRLADWNAARSRIASAIGRR